MTKVIHVHLIFEKRDFYFGSISAVYDTLDEDRIGIKKSSLMHCGLTDGGVKMTKRAIIKQSHLIRSGGSDQNGSEHRLNGIIALRHLT